MASNLSNPSLPAKIKNPPQWRVFYFRWEATETNHRSTKSSGTILDSRRLAPQGGVGPMDGTNNPSLPAQSANSRYAAHPVPHPPGHRLRRCSISHPAFAVDKSSGTILDSRRLVPQRGVAPMDGTNHPSLAAKDANRFLGTSCASPFEPRASAYCHRQYS